MPCMPAINRIVVLPNHMRKFIRAIRLLTVIFIARKSIGWSAHPELRMIWFTGPTIENMAKKSIENADAMIRLGM